MSETSLLRQSLPSWSARVWAVLMGVASEAAMLGLLILSMWLIVRAGEQPPILHLTFAVVGVRALALGRAVFRYLERLIMHDRALAQLAELRVHTFTRLIPLVPGGLEHSPVGDVHARLVDDVDQLQDYPLRVRQPLAVSVGTLLIGLLIVGGLDLRFAMVNLIMLSLATVIGTLVLRRVRSRQQVVLPQLRAELNDALIERIDAATVLRVFHAEAAHEARIDEISGRYARAQRRGAGTASFLAALTGACAASTSLGTVWLITEQEIGALSAPVLAALIIAPVALFEVLANVWPALQRHPRVTASAQRLSTLLAQDPPVLVPAQPDDDALLSTSDGAALLDLHTVTTRYPGAPRDVFTPVSFSVRQGETVLITGESGSGKSTLARILVRFLDHSGQVRLCGHDIREIPATRVRSLVGLCEQHPHIFDSSLRQNLMFASPGTDDAALWQQLERVGLATWARTRAGLDTMLGEQGARVSGGQAQRISLARVLLADPPLVILDEPTAGVDEQEAERIMRELLGAVPAHKAVMVISHLALPSDVSVHQHVQVTPSQ